MQVCLVRAWCFGLGVEKARTATLGGGGHRRRSPAQEWSAATGSYFQQWRRLRFVPLAEGAMMIRPSSVRCSSSLRSLALLPPARKGRANRDHSNPTSHRRAKVGETGAKESRAKARAKLGHRKVRQPVSEDQLLAAIGRLVQRASVSGAHGLGDRLRTVLASAEAGQSLKSGRTERRRRAKEKKRLASGKQSFYAAFPQQAPKVAEQISKGKGSDSKHVAPPQPTWQLDKSAEAITAGEARRRMHEQRPLQAQAVVVKSSEEATELRNLARVNEVQGKIALVSQNDLGNEATHRDITCVRDGRREVKKWQELALTSEGCPAKPAVRRTSTFQPPSRELQTVRVLAVKDYMEPMIWRNLLDGPKEVVSRLLGTRPHRAEGWKQLSTQGGDQHFVGYLTFVKAEAEKALASSGRNGIFVEKLARDQTTRPLLQWIQPGNLQGISYLRHAIMEAAGKPLAFRKGQGAALGVRAQKGETLQVASNWRVCGVPKSWSEQDVVDALTGASFQEVTVISEASGSRPWLVRGVLGGDTGELALLVETGSKELRVERVVGRQQEGRYSEKLWQPPKANRKAPAAAAPSGLPTTHDQAAVSEDMEVDSAANAETGPSTDAQSGQQSKPEAGQGSTAGVTPAKRQRAPDSGRLGKNAWDEKECGAAGHCFYNCVTAGFVLKTSKTTFTELEKDLASKGRGLRSRIASYIQGHEDRFRPFFEPSRVDPAAPDQKEAAEYLAKVEDGDPPQDWQDYLQAIWRPARWADEISFRAAAALLGVNLQLVCGNLDKPDKVLTYHNAKSTTVLYLHHSLGHYTLLLPKGENMPDYILPVSSPQEGSQVFAPRGGGLSAHDAIDDSWIPAEASTDEDRPISAAPCRLSDAPEVESQDRRSASRSDLMRKVARAVAKARVRKHTVGRKKQWQCNVCSLTLRENTMRALSVARFGHIKRVHPKVPLDRFTDLRSFIGVTSTVFDTPSPAWMCGYCHAFLPRMQSKYAQSKSAKHHLSQCPHAPAKVTLMQNMRQILAAEGLPVPKGNANVCQAFGRKIDLQTFRPSPKELEGLQAAQARSSSPVIRRHKASSSCVFQGGPPCTCKKRSGSKPAHAAQPPEHGEQAVQGPKRRGSSSAFVESVLPAGRFRFALSSQPRAEMQRQAHVTEAEGRFRCELKPPPRDGGWIRDLTEENIESNPGPPAASVHKLRVTIWNSQGHQHIFDALAAQVFRDVDVVMLQEVNLSSVKRKDLIMVAAAHGYHSYFSASTAEVDCAGRALNRGGLATLVRQELPSRVVGCAKSAGNFETLSVRIDGIGCLVNCHHKPGGCWHQSRVHLEELLSQEPRLVLGGDLNLLPSEARLAGIEHLAAPCQADGSLQPTRVGGQRCIDYFLGKGICLQDATRADESLSDHFPVQVELETAGNPREHQLVLRPTTFYGLPQGAEPAAYTSAQDAHWQLHPVPPDSGDTEEEWRSPHRRAKGTGFSTIGRSAFAPGRLLKLQGRIREWQRQARLGASTDHLHACVARSWLNCCGALPQTPAEAEHLVTTCIADFQATQAREAVHRWQRKLAARGREATKWLKGRQRRITGVLGSAGGPQGGVLSTTASLQHIQAFWAKIWDRPLVCRERALRAWRRHGRHQRCSFQAEHVWQPEALHKAAISKASSAPGIDGWRGEEVKYWPRSAWAAYAVLLKRWAARGSFPQAWQAMRQVQVPKAEAADLSGEIAASDLRPIVVMSILWRVTSSTVASCEAVQNWQAAVLAPSQFGGIKGRHVHHGIGSLAGPFTEGSPLASLDYAKCFDHVDPALACDVMQEAGFPATVLRMLRHTWDQTRFLEVNGCTQATGHRVLASLPQGDGLAPLALNVAEHFGAALQQSVFLDDRAFTVARIVSLRFYKLGTDGRSCLAGLGHWLKGQTRVLGVDFVARPEDIGATTTARTTEALRLGRKLLAKGIALDIRRDLWRTRIVPLATWGHLFAAPAAEDVKALRNLGAAVLYSHRAASIHLRRLLEGHNMDFLFQAGMHAVHALHASTSWSTVARSPNPGSWFARVKGFLCDMGWHPESTTVFTTSQARIDFGADRIGAIAHRLRAQWRQQQLAGFIASGRRDAARMQGWNPGAAVVSCAVKLYQQAPAEGKAVLSGAACSTAYYEVRKTGSASSTCTWCGAPVAATWEHLAWHCPAMLGERPARPRDEASCRLGWPQAGETLNQAADRLRWLVFGPVGHSSLTHDGSGTRRRKGDDDGSRRRKGDDDDGSGTRRRKGDDDGSRRRKGDDDDGSGSWHGSTSTWCQRASEEEEQNFNDMIKIKAEANESSSEGSGELGCYFQFEGWRGSQRPRTRWRTCLMANVPPTRRGLFSDVQGIMCCWGLGRPGSRDFAWLWQCIFDALLVSVLGDAGAWDSESGTPKLSTRKTRFRWHRCQRCKTARFQKRHEQRPLQAQAVVVKSSEEATELRNLARVNEVQGKIALVSQNDLGNEATHRDITCVRDGRHEVKKWQELALTSEGCPAKPAVRRTSTFQPPSRELQTVRVLAVKDYMEPMIWRNLLDGPKEVVSRLLGTRPHRAEGWKQLSTQGGDQHFVGYLTFVKAEAEKALASSGRNGIFVEKLARDQTTRPLLQWIQPGNLQGISYLRHAIMEAAGKPLAFRKGQGAALGVRAQKGETLQVASNWRVRGVPKSWSEQDVVDALTGASFQEVTVISEASGSRPWLVRGVLGGDTGELALLVETGSKELRVERVVGRQQEGRYSEKLWQPPKANRKAPAAAAPSGLPTTHDQAAVSEDMEVDSAANAETGPSTDAQSGQQSKPEAGQGSTAGVTPAKRQRAPDSGRLGRNAWDEKECGAAGHCFYNCVTAGFVLKTSKTTFTELEKDLASKGRGLRSRIASYIQGHEDRFRPFFEPSRVDPAAPDQKEAAEYLAKVEDGDPPQDWQDYLQAIWRPARWADEISFRAAAALLGVNLQLVCGNLDKPDKVLTYHNAKSTTVLYLHHSLGHYTLLLPKGENMPDYILPVSSPQEGSQVFAPRGGGLSAHDAIDDSWIPAEASTDEDRPISAAPCRLSDAPEVESQDRRSASRSDLMRKVARAVAKARVRKHTVGRKKQWQCNVCSLTLRENTMRALSVARFGHIKRVHPKVPLDRFTDLRSFIGVTSTVFDTPSPAWMCGYCHAFLPRMQSKYAQSKSAKHHLSQCPHAPAKVTLMQNMRQILAAEGLPVPKGNANVCQAFGRKIDLQTFRPSPKELEGLQAAQARSSSPVTRRHKASSSCVFQGGPPCTCKKRSGSKPAHAAQPPEHGEQAVQGPKRRGSSSAFVESVLPAAAGRFRFALSSQPRAEMQRQAHVTEAEGRFRCELKPPPRDGGWIRDLTEENIESNPGPPAASVHKLRVTIWNSQGHQHIFDALAAQVFRDVDVVMLQEVNLSSVKRKDLIMVAAAHGYHSYFSASTAEVDCAGRALNRGGLATLVRQELPSRVVGCAKSVGNFETLSVRIDGIGCLELLSQEPRLVLGGDLNLLPSEARLAGIEHLAAPCQADGSLQPTRVGGQRCMDYFLGKGICLQDATRADESLSDHFPVQVELETAGNPREHQLVLRPTTFYGLPQGAEPAAYTSAQDAHWQLHPVPPDSGDTEEEWRWFSATAEGACRHATAVFGCIRDPPHRRAKGTGFSTIGRSALHRGGTEAHSFHMRRLLKLQGRIREWQRQARLGASTDHLHACVARSWLNCCGALPQTPAEAEHLVTTCIADFQATQAREAVHRWQRKLAARGREATKWLKGRQRRITGVLGSAGGPQGGVLSTTASLQHIQAFWAKIWDRPLVCRERALRAWRRHGRHQRCSFQAEHVWQPEALHKAAISKASSAPGIDGWRGEEVKYWPRSAWAAYAVLLKRWAARGSFPQAWQAMRQVQVPKAEAADLSGEIAASDLRPIVVMSILWRVTSSTVASCEAVQNWQAAVLAPSQFGGIKGRHVHHGIGSLAGPFTEGSPLASLDYAKCFDHVDPALACDVMQEAGFPATVLRMLRHTWDQTRFLEVNGCTQATGHRVLASLPQGDGLAPLALNVLLSSPCRQVAEHFGAALQQSVFLDDRAFTVAPHRIPEVLQAWDRWSQLLGLRENITKRAVVCNSTAAADTVRQAGLGHWLKGQTPDIGATTTARTTEALRLGRKLLAKGIALDIRRDLWRTRIVPLATWGHLFAAPAAEDVKALRNLGAAVLYSHRAASIHLRRLLEGHNMDFLFQAGMHAVHALHASTSWSTVARSPNPGSWFARVKGFLCDMGWHPESTTVFTTSQARIDFGADRIGAIAHRLRAQWRQQQLAGFIASGRRDAARMQGWNPGAAVVSCAVKLYQQAPAEGKAVLSGAACSTAYYEVRKTGSASSTCTWCGAPVAATWEHLAWHCPAMLGERPARPRDEASCRLGWPQAGETLNQAADRLRWLVFGPVGHSSLTHDGSGTRRRKGDDDGSRRRKGDDDDGSGTRRRKGDDDGSRRRKGDDDGSGTRRRKGDDDGSRRRKYSHHRRHYKDGDD
ncbi:infB [Symbiodinium sp. CCMP2592]|nr:infB [Symbiodinium sp. CCMP2592]